MKYLIDTNVLLDYPQIITEQENIVIITDVLRELDGLKLNQNTEVSFKARRAAVVISRHLDKIDFSEHVEEKKMSVDDKLIAVAEMFNGLCTIITNDVYLKIKAILKGIPTQGYGGTTDYTGVYYFDVNTDDNYYSEDLEKVLSKEQKLPVKENQYVIVRDKAHDNQILGIFINKNNSLEEIHSYGIENKWINKISPRNPEQQCLFNALFDKNNTIIYAGGSFGTGKSFILNNYALSQLEKGRIKKIVYVPNNAYTANTMELGFLPGELIDKIVGQIGPLIDLVGIDEVHHLIATDMLEVVPIGSIRGRSFTDSIVIVNEAQNLTDDHIKLLIARIGDGSRIFFDGDYKQTDSAIFKNKNGLKLLLNLADSPEYASLFATVKLTKTERSKTAQAVEYLDFISGSI